MGARAKRWRRVEGWSRPTRRGRAEMAGVEAQAYLHATLSLSLSLKVTTGLVPFILLKTKG